ncbi:SN-glycerol-3-phosphate transport system permease protein ugpE [Roseomonas mucosa]|uniref:sn-glycerol-3-phosphate transport system permease protein UgpE n=1 Tax=Roseomonas mucosa TaxID=207340 RepID=A0A1S8D9I0_9PROT|nr:MULTISPECIES: sn-glycerol-3-phosphate ABC transporter permease UgpE [Roseomonas]MBS5901209.1 sn-glycerol-3-phosphate ABC transporter permease UgpE [Acetobacteraceae bacterium]AWV23132.1 SN-glycerol-3-phosphate transport system permease protein ugpE [Roseomonas mucosa]MCG7352447.1 sn-glycerol-3-phosphate ABC transporter permease UgpE [Roseomonas mucosa]MCG7355528.1 sn-glycerol-3-phosphate ABC transporter permease UgpE [Roseomonas mucosa]MDT8274431.1 sn-glycerol-3-phosphate ABC transporter pe
MADAATATRHRQARSKLLAHALLILGVLIFAFPIWIALMGSTHDASTLGRGEVPLLPGPDAVENYATAWTQGGGRMRTTPAWVMLWNSALMALIIAVGKITISMLSAFAVVFFRFPFRMTCFWLIFITLMLPVEVRLIPTFQVMVDLRLTDTMTGLTLPLIASATATLLFRQFFLTIPDELAEAARLDGAGPLRFLRDVVLPLSRNSIAALFVILFIYGWNQYLWPLLIVTDRSLETIVVGLSKSIGNGDSQNEWNTIMAMAVLALLPPVAVVVAMQRWFVRGLTETEK